MRPRPEYLNHLGKYEESSEINWGKCTFCLNELEQEEFVQDKVCDECRPDFIKNWQVILIEGVFKYVRRPSS
jgi:hypothetical protein